MKTRPTKLQLAAGTAIADPLAAASATGEPVGRVQLFPMGDVNARDGRKWRIRDLAHAQAIVHASTASAGDADLPIDYDHQLVFSAQPGVGGRAAAAGWMSNLRADENGIHADVEWTAGAAAQLKAKEYRYISPYFSFDQASGDVRCLYHAGLTNFPAITELAAVASADPTGDFMDKTALTTALGLAATATDAEILAAIAANKASATAAAATALQPVAIALGLKDPWRASGHSLTGQRRWVRVCTGTRPCRRTWTASCPTSSTRASSRSRITRSSCTWRPTPARRSCSP